MPFCSGRCESTAKLTGKTAIITGCNTGIGKETVLDFYKRGARVIMACRNLEKAEDAKNAIEKACKELPDTGNIVVEKCDLTSLKSVREFCQKILDREPQINILVNNAGVMMCPKSETEDGFEMQFGTNHLAHYFLTLLLLPRIIKSAPARIVTVSSLAHTQFSRSLIIAYGSIVRHKMLVYTELYRSWKQPEDPKWTQSHDKFVLKIISGYGINFEDLNFKKRSYNAIEAYSQSKLANLMFSRELANRLKINNIEGVNTYSLHPGVINTELGRHLNDTMFKGAKTILSVALAPCLKSPESGAQTTIYCAVDEKCANETGLYYSDCKVTSPSKKALNNDNAEKLWDMSAELVGLGDFNPFTANDNGIVQK